MSDVLDHPSSNVVLLHAATEAEALTARLEDQGVSVYMVQPPATPAFLVFEHTTIPPSLAATGTMRRINSLFLSEPRFAQELFGWLFATGQVLQLFAEHQPALHLGTGGGTR